MSVHSRMAAGLVAGLCLGLATAATQHPALLYFTTRALRPFGTLFLNLLSMVVIPLVAATLFTGVAGLGDLRRVGSLGGRALAFFWITTICAVAIGFTVAALLLPLAPLAPEHQATLRGLAAQDSSVVQRAVEQIPSGAAFLVELVPRNPVRAAVDGALLPLLVFVTFAGVAAAGLPAARRAPLLAVGEATSQALIRIVGGVLLVAPLGICALVAAAVAQFGWALVRAMLVFVLAVAAGVTVFIAGVYLPAVRVLGRTPPARFLRGGLTSLAMGFSTTSSLAALPTMLEAAGGPLALPRETSGFVLPLAATLNRGGSAVYQAVAVAFVAGLYGVPFGPDRMASAGLAVFLASLTVAAVPSGSVISLAPAFAQTGLPLSGISLLMGLDRLPDMLRTMTNVAGHLAAATVLGRRAAPGPE